MLEQYTDHGSYDRQTSQSGKQSEGYIFSTNHTVTIKVQCYYSGSFLGYSGGAKSETSFKQVLNNHSVNSCFAHIEIDNHIPHTGRPRPIMLKILPIMLLSNAQIFDLLCSILCSCVHKN